MNNFLKIKNFIEDEILKIKNHFQSSKYVVKGKCKQCGQCCSMILFSNDKGYIKDLKEFEKLKKKHSFYSFFTPNGKITEETLELEGAYMFKCKHLSDKNKCKIYLFRPIFCRDYPCVNSQFIKMGGVMLPNCGFYFEPDKKFEEYLK